MKYARSRRVGVTGVGVVSAFGDNSKLFWDAISSGRCGIAENDYLAGSLPGVASVAYVQGYDPSDHFQPVAASKLATFTQFAMVAAREAVNDAGLKIDANNAGRVAILIGTSSGGMDVYENGYERLFGRNLSSISPTTIMRGMYNAPGSQLSIELGIKGPVFSTSSACSSAGHAIALSFWMVRSGIVDAAICGGAEALRNLGMLKAWEAMRVLSPGLCRPFSADRDGCTLGEGAGVVVIEDFDTAQRRGASVYCEMVGVGMSADATDLVIPNIEGPVLAMRSALEDAGLSISDIDHINAHGTGTKLNDLTEAKAINQLFGEHAPAIQVSGTKSMHGHLLGAASGIEFVATCLATHHQLVPPTINVGKLDPQCQISINTGAAKSCRIRTAMSNSLAFGGLNTSLVVAQC